MKQNADHEAAAKAYCQGAAYRTESGRPGLAACDRSCNNLLRRLFASIVMVLLAMNGQASVALAEGSSAGEYGQATELPYRNHSGDEYSQKMCRLDIYYPKGVTDFPTVVWFHGGGLTSGKRKIPAGLKGKGIAVVAADYRLSPTIKAPVYIEDAAAAVAWTINNVARYGGNPSKVFVSGHSAGGYLATMVGIDQRWLSAHEIDTSLLAGVISYSGHSITHFTVRAERGINGKTPVIDNFAPLNHVRKDAPPMLLITGDRNLEMLGRYEETAYFWRMMQVVGHPKTEIRELKGFDHSGMAVPAHRFLLRFVEEVVLVED